MLGHYAVRHAGHIERKGDDALIGQAHTPVFIKDFGMLGRRIEALRRRTDGQCDLHLAVQKYIGLIQTQVVVFLDDARLGGTGGHPAGACGGHVRLPAVKPDAFGP